jgi:hypothetical protein
VTQESITIGSKPQKLILESRRVNTQYEKIMHYLKSLFFNFLIIFLSFHIFAGIDLMDPTKLPHIGKDLFFAAGLGFLNSLIYPMLKVIDSRGIGLRIFFIAILLNFAAYALLKLLPLGISIDSLKSYAIVAGVVSLGSIFANYFEMKLGCKSTRQARTHEEPEADQDQTHHDDPK